MSIVSSTISAPGRRIRPATPVVVLRNRSRIWRRLLLTVLLAVGAWVLATATSDIARADETAPPGPESCQPPDCLLPPGLDGSVLAPGGQPPVTVPDPADPAPPVDLPDEVVPPVDQVLPVDEVPPVVEEPPVTTTEPTAPPTEPTPEPPAAPTPEPAVEAAMPADPASAAAEVPPPPAAVAAVPAPVRAEATENVPQPADVVQTLALPPVDLGADVSAFQAAQTLVAQPVSGRAASPTAVGTSTGTTIALARATTTLLPGGRGRPFRPLQLPPSQPPAPACPTAAAVPGATLHGTDHETHADCTYAVLGTDSSAPPGHGTARPRFGLADDVVSGGHDPGVRPD